MEHILPPSGDEAVSWGLAVERTIEKANTGILARQNDDMEWLSRECSTSSIAIWISLYAIGK